MEETQEQKLIRSEIRKLADDFGDEYWREKDEEGEFPWEFFNTFSEAGWTGVSIPEEYGGHGYGLVEANIIQEELGKSGVGVAGHSTTAHHIFSAMPLVKFGDEEHKQRYLPKIASGDVMVCTGVTEPNAGMNTLEIETFAEKDGDEYVVNGQKIWTSKAAQSDVIMLLVRTSEYDPDNRTDGLSLFFTEFGEDMDGITLSEIEKLGRHAVPSYEVWYEDFRIPEEDLIGEEGKGINYLFEFANAERVNVASGAIGTGFAALDRAAQYAREREVFDGPIGQYQGIQHPLADSWSKLKADQALCQKVAQDYDNGNASGSEANALKLRAGFDALEACERAVRTHGGMGYAKEYHVERFWKEIMIFVLAPVSGEMAKNHIAQYALDLPRSY